MEIVLATTNPGKIAEVTSLLKGSDFCVLSIHDAQVPSLDVEETGATFRENAELKARAFAIATGLPVLADDSGLEVAALDGAPGVKSARWISGSDEDRNTALLEKLSDTHNRSASFTTVVCYLETADGTPHFFEGTVSGTISTTPAGTKGFGYDPIFIPKKYDQTFAQLGIEVKNKLSHRAKAFKQAAQFLINRQN